MVDPYASERAHAAVIAEASPSEGAAPAVSYGDHRMRRFGLALGAGIVSKLLATVMQLAAFPLALNALGTERYAALLTLQALVAWSGLLGLGLAPSLPRFLAGASVLEDRKQQRDLLVSSTALIGMASLALLLLLILLPTLTSPTSLVAGGEVLSAEVNAGYYVVVIMQSASLFLSLVPAIRSGYQELHYSYIWSSVANLCAIGLLLLITEGEPTISIFFAALYGPILAVTVLDAMLIVWQRPYLVGGRPDLLRTARELGPHAANALAVQFSYFTSSSVPVLIVAHLADPTATAAFGSLMQLLMLGYSGMNLLFLPLVAALANANAHEDWPWIRAIYWRTIGLVATVCGVVGGLAIISGPQLAHFWLNADLHISRPLTSALGLHFGVWMLGLLHFNVLAAIGGLAGIGRAYAIQSGLAVVLGIVLTQLYGATGMATALFITSLCVTGWYLPWRVLDIVYSKGR